MAPEGRNTLKTPPNPPLDGIFPNFSFIPQHSQNKCSFTGVCAELKRINDLNWGKESASCLIQLSHQGIAEPGALDTGLGCRTQNDLPGDEFGM